MSGCRKPSEENGPLPKAVGRLMALHACAGGRRGEAGVLECSDGGPVR